MKDLQIKMKEIYKAYGNLDVIVDFNMSFSSKKIHCFFGPSGCGKTTLVNILTGIIYADSGGVEGLEEKKISYVFQEDRLLPWATIEENILFVLESSYNIDEAQQLVDKYLSLVGLLKFKNYYPDELSGGMKQRVSIARAFAYGGQILVMDEPFKGLHLELKKNLMDHIINNWDHKNSFFFFITHDIDEALYLADNIYLFQGLPLTLKKQVDIDIPPYNREKYSEEMAKYKKIILQNT